MKGSRYKSTLPSFRNYIALLSVLSYLVGFYSSLRITVSSKVFPLHKTASFVGSLSKTHEVNKTHKSQKAHEIYKMHKDPPQIYISSSNC